MVRTLFAAFVILHGLVHLWFVVLSQELVPFEPEMGWTGESWLFTDLLRGISTRWLATILYTLITVAFVVSGIGVFARGEWWRPLMAGAAALSALTIFILWDGGFQHIVPKGLIGLLLDVGILLLILVLRWPASQT